MKRLLMTALVALCFAAPAYAQSGPNQNEDPGNGGGFFCNSSRYGDLLYLGGPAPYGLQTYKCVSGGPGFYYMGPGGTWYYTPQYQLYPWFYWGWAGAAWRPCTTISGTPNCYI